MQDRSVCLCLSPTPGIRLRRHEHMHFISLIKPQQERARSVPYSTTIIIIIVHLPVPFGHVAEKKGGIGPTQYACISILISGVQRCWGRSICIPWVRLSRDLPVQGPVSRAIDGRPIKIGSSGVMSPKRRVVRDAHVGPCRLCQPSQASTVRRSGHHLCHLIRTPRGKGRKKKKGGCFISRRVGGASHVSCFGAPKLLWRTAVLTVSDVVAARSSTMRTMVISRYPPC